ncbi:MAG TPA: DNA recombination protein RmuC [Verrucomicrobiae bacterium]|nr:DNA recombination protein RmuC [Verrucomicrobiae bacterium]
MSTTAYLLTGLALGGLFGALIGWLTSRSRNGTSDVSGTLNGMERNLSAEFQKANLDMATRVERIKGDLISDLTGRLQNGFNEVRETLDQQLAQGRNEQAQRLADGVKLLEQKFEALKSATEGKLESSSQQQGLALKDSRNELVATLSKMAEQTGKELDKLKTAVEAKLAQIQMDNAAKLEEMRKTVDEKLQGTLDKRLGESFKIVSDRLEQVHKGLGEMQTLAVGVGDLKKVLTNVKTRGTWGEVQLGNLLEQILTQEQFEKNVITKAGSAERVEFAIKLPGRDDGRPVWLPIDAKFPKEDYERLVEAAERADTEAVEQAAKQLEARVKMEAANIQKKYIDVPNTTDFGILFLPTEGLYAEVLRRTGIADLVQRDYRVIIAGPTTLAALLNSLQMGFRTLAIEKRSSEVWTVLGAVKTEFGKFGGIIEKVQKKLQEASNVIDEAVVRKNAVERKLKTVTDLPVSGVAPVLADVPMQIEETDAAEN